MSSTFAPPRPIPPFAGPNPQANCLKTGTVEDVPRVAEDFAAVNTRTHQWYADIRPQNYFHSWMITQMAITSVRIDRNSRTERRLRDRSALHAELFWDRDRAIEAEKLGEGLASSPAAVVLALRRTPHGCDWMIGRWSHLARHADLQGGTWDRAQTSTAFDLLDVRPEDRVGQPGETIDLEGRLVEPAPDPASLARREVAALLKAREEVAGPDNLDRALATADYVDGPGEDLRQLRRHDAELHRRLKWFIHQINVKSPYPCTSPKVYDYFQPNPLVEPEPRPRPEPAVEAEPATALEPATEAEAEPDDEDATPVVAADFPPPQASARVEKRLKDAERRRLARLRKLERHRA